MYQSAELTPLGKGKRLLVLLLAFIGCMALAMIIASVLAVVMPVDRNYLLSVSVIQNLLGFVCASWIAARFASFTPWRWLGAKNSGSAVSYIIVLIALVLLIPALNFLTAWNEGWDFGPFQAILKSWEDSAQDTTELLTSGTSIWDLISGILFIGILTGIGEEFLFRGALQRILSDNGINHHAAIFIAALIFSAIHFQFFGFMPRLVLGILLGYAYYNTGSIWVSATFHAANNSLVVLTTWLAARGTEFPIFEEIGTPGHWVWLAPISIILGTLILFTLKGKSNG